MSRSSAASITPSVHFRVVITWMAITVIALAVRFVLSPVMSTWDGYLQLLITVAFVVPIAVYLVVPRALALWSRFAGRRQVRRARALNAAVAR